jgi:hypothetical protein
MLLKYFSNSTKTNEATNVEQENSNDPDIIETSVSSSKENDSSILAVMDALNQSVSSNSNTNNMSESNCDSMQKKSESSSSSKMPAHQNIMSLLINQKPKMSNDDDSDADVDVDVLVDETPSVSTLKSSKSTEKIIDFLNKPPDDFFLEDVDYVMCEKCNKRILCWDMPEHEDFHFAQTISRQMSSSLSEDREQIVAKKRPVEEISSNNDIKEKKLLNNKNSSSSSNTNKKIKVDVAQTSSGVASNKSNVKSIDNYFKKQNKS